MSEPDVDLYAASCNPPRRAKRSPATSAPLTSETTMPAVKQNMPPDDGQAYPAPPTPAKRGRKPGPLSRAAREAQRRLNHSIIEKARRTKINDALAALRELVPLDYSQPKTPTFGAVDSEVEDDCEEYQPASSKSNKNCGKKQEKEKEFKLEILIRTVTYMKDLIGRVAELEAQVGAQNWKDTTRLGPPSRKRRLSQIDLEDAETPPGLSNRPKRDSYVRTQELSDRVPSCPLPSISSWLRESDIDPSLLPPKPEDSPADVSSYLPSPPSSIHFDPIRTAYHPPSLSLGPLDTPSLTSGSSARPLLRTAEDESAATLLLQMSTSPVYRSGLGGGSTLADPSKMALTPGSFSSSPPSKSGHQQAGSTPSPPSSRLQAQTPASILGLTHLLRPITSDDI